MKKLFIIFAVLCLAAPTMAAEWDFYGSSRLGTWRTSNDIGNPTDSDDDTSWYHHGNSRFGATVKFNDQIGGAIEMSESFGKRKLYGTYAFGGSELLVGQTYTPSSSMFYSNSVYATDGDLLGVGQHYVGRVPMIQWSIAGFKLALIEPNTSAGNPVGNDDATYGVYNADGSITTAGVTSATPNSFVLTPETGTISDTDVDLPKIELAYKFKTDMFFAEVFGGYQSYTADGATKDYDIDAYVVGLGGGLTLGPVFFNAGVHMGQNLGNYGSSGFASPDNATTGQKDNNKAGKATYSATADDIIDNDALGYLAVLGFNISEMFTVEVGYGYMEYEPDTSNSKSDNATQYYMNCTVNIAPNFFIVPEIGKIDYEAAEQDAGDVLYYGAKWQINF